jgi:hypothetical protein
LSNRCPKHGDLYLGQIAPDTVFLDLDDRLRIPQEGVKRGGLIGKGQYYESEPCGRYYKPITIVNDDSSVINKLETSPIDNARVVIYDHHMFIVQATGVNLANSFMRNGRLGVVS